MDKNGKIEWVSSLRGLAAMCVLFEHLLQYIEVINGHSISWIHMITAGVMDIGKIGVALLFLLSGYLTPTICSKKGLPEFVINRVFRLYPVYWFSIILLGILLGWGEAGNFTIIANFTMLQVFLGQEDLMGVFWTMPIQLMLYLAIILFMKFIWDRRSIKITFSLACLGTILLGIIRKYIWSNAPVAIGLLLTIALLGHIMRISEEASEISEHSFNIYIYIYETTVLIVSLLAYLRSVNHGETWYKYFISYTMAVLAAYLFKKFKASNNIFTFLGMISYDIYLLQEIVNTYMFEIIWPAANHFSIWVFSALVFVITIFVSWITHITIEKTGVKVERKLRKRMI